MAEGKGPMFVRRHYSNTIRIEINKGEDGGTREVERKFVEEGAGGDIRVAFSLYCFKPETVFNGRRSQIENNTVIMIPGPAAQLRWKFVVARAWNADCREFSVESWDWLEGGIYVFFNDEDPAC